MHTDPQFRRHQLTIFHTGTTMPRPALSLHLFLAALFSFIGAALSLQNEIRIGARPSALATIQAEAVMSHLKEHHPSITTVLVPIQASGDVTGNKSTSVVQDVPLAFSNVDFTEALDEAVLDGRIDVAVHSLKDIRPDHRWHSGLSIHCPLPREDSADVLIGPYSTLEEVPFGARIGTSSIRRQAQIRYKCSRQDIQIVNLRGNVEARLQALERGDVDALVLARSGLHRLGLDDDGCDGIHCTSIPSVDLLPAACQGIVAAVVLENGDYDTDEFWRANSDATVMAHAERSFLNTLDGSSPWQGRPPLAGRMDQEASSDPSDRRWIFQGLLARPDGERVVLAEKSIQLEKGGMYTTKEMAAVLGEQVGHELLEKAGPQFYEASAAAKASD
jgi:hydroxymethylbilane synthase